MRTRRVLPWVLYAVCALAVLEGVGYASYKALDLQRQRREEEAARLALWRMDSALTALLAVESARPYFHYRPFHSAERAYSAMLGPIEPGEVLVPSPLLTEVPPFVRLHFEIDASGTVTSPQAPDGNLRDVAEAEYVAADDVIAAEALRLMLRDLLSTEDGLGVVGLEVTTLGEDDADWWARNQFAASAQLGQSVSTPSPEPAEAASELVDGEEARLERSVGRAVPMPQQRQLPATDLAFVPPEVVLGPLAATWLAGDELVLLRDVRVGRAVLRQGVWLDWPALHRWLLAQVQDVAPEASLVPGAGQSRSLAVIPARLEIEPNGGVLAELASPLGIVLVLTWLAALLAIVAIGVVLRLATSLAERRGRFVSAVTHELRTPMTSVRLYADLLASDAASDDRRRASFVATLRDESARLARIIENVLAYARLGRANCVGASRAPAVATVIEKAVQEHATTLEHAGLSIIENVDPGVAGRIIDADEDAAVRIVGNLLENAAKYAHPHARGEVEVEVRAHGDAVIVTVRDWGPGVPPEERRRVFEAFHRAARDEFKRDGLGLGLALSRGLARQMGGDLTLDVVEAGASFTVRLPLRPD